MTDELQKEFNELNKYKDIVHLLWDYIDEIKYDEKHYVLTVYFNENVFNTEELTMFVSKENAEKMFEVFTLMEQENGIQQDEVEYNE